MMKKIFAASMLLVYMFVFTVNAFSEIRFEISPVNSSNARFERVESFELPFHDSEDKKHYSVYLKAVYTDVYGQHVKPSEIFWIPENSMNLRINETESPDTIKISVQNKNTHMFGGFTVKIGNETKQILFKYNAW